MSIRHSKVVTKALRPVAEQRWLDWAQRAQRIAQAGLAFTEDAFNQARYQALRELALEILEAGVRCEDDLERGNLKQLFASDTGYPTPKVDVRALVIYQGLVLMVKEREDALWSIPGGWADQGWTPSKMAEREVLEEAGVVVRASRLLAVWSQDRHTSKSAAVPEYKLCFECDYLCGEPIAHPETLEAAWVSPQRVPPLSESRITCIQLGHLMRLQQDPDAKVMFD